MFVQEEKLVHIAKAFREAFETTGRTYESGFLMYFPEGCCTWASLFIGKFLVEEYSLSPQRIHSDPEPPTHRIYQTSSENG